MPNPHCTCELHSPLPDVAHAPSCPLFRAPTHEQAQHRAAYGVSPAWAALQRLADGELECPVEKLHQEGVALLRSTLVEADPADIVGSRPVEVLPTLPDGAAERKSVPLVSGLLDYFPAALMAVAAISKVGNDQHNPGQPLHWERGKSGDEADALLRHLADRGLIDTDGARHSAKVAWRALALLQKELEEAGLAPVSRGSWA